MRAPQNSQECWRGGQLSYLYTPQPPEALLSAGSLWSSLTSCSMLPSAAGPVLGGKPSLVTDTGTTVLLPRHERGTQPGTLGLPPGHQRVSSSTAVLGHWDFIPLQGASWD